MAQEMKENSPLKECPRCGEKVVDVIDGVEICGLCPWDENNNY